MGYPNGQNNPNGAIPVWIASGGGAIPPAPGQSVIDYTQVALSDGAVHTLAAPPDGTVSAAISIEGGNARWLYADDPTADVGMPIWATAPVTPFALSTLDDLRFHRMGATGSPIVNVMYFGVAP